MRLPAATTICVLTGLTACVTQPDQGGQESTDSSSDSVSNTESESDSSSETEMGSDEGPPPIPPLEECPCDPDELCVGICSYDDGSWSGEAGLSLSVLRCIAGDACMAQDFDTPECREEACGDPYDRPLVSSCAEYAVGEPFDLICLLGLPSWCDTLFQDCADGWKCIPQLAGEEELGANCVPVVGMDPVGSPCSFDGEFDSCDAQGVCWNGSPRADPFEGTCQAFCAWEDFACPEGTTCEELQPNIFLCL